MNTDTDVLILRKFSYKIYIDNERNMIAISDDKESDERYQMGKNDEDRLADDI